MLKLTHRGTGDRRSPLFELAPLFKLGLIAAAATSLTLKAPILAQDGKNPPAGVSPQSEWRSSPFHGVVGGDGNVIPCRCLFRGTAYKLGERVCMNTHLGTVIAECDLQQNNTSWIPTAEACTTS